MNFIVHYRILFENKSFDGTTTARDVDSEIDARLTVVSMIRAAAPGSRIEITATKQTNDDDLATLARIVKI